MARKKYDPRVGGLLNLYTSRPRINAKNIRGQRDRPDTPRVHYGIGVQPRDLKWAELATSVDRHGHKSTSYRFGFSPSPARAQSFPHRGSAPLRTHEP